MCTSIIQLKILPLAANTSTALFLSLSKVLYIFCDCLTFLNQFKMFIAISVKQKHGVCPHPLYSLDLARATLALPQSHRDHEK